MMEEYHIQGYYESRLDHSKREWLYWSSRDGYITLEEAKEQIKWLVKAGVRDISPKWRIVKCLYEVIE